MSLTLTVFCAQCGKVLQPSFAVEMKTRLSPEAIKATVEKHKPWIVELNGDYIDAYCCKRCCSK